MERLQDQATGNINSDLTTQGLFRVSTTHFAADHMHSLLITSKRVGSTPAIEIIVDFAVL